MVETKSQDEKHHFFTVDGKRVSTVGELISVISSMDGTSFSHHVNSSKNDFSVWLNDCFGEKELSEKLKSAKTKEDILSILKDNNKDNAEVSAGEVDNMPVDGNESNKDAQSLGSLVSSIDKIAHGNLNISIDESLLKRDDEVGVIAKSVNKLLGNFGDTLSSASNQAVTTAAAAEELSASSEEVNSSMEQVSSTLQEITKGIQDLSKNAGDVAKKSKLTGESAQRGSKAASAVKEKMTAISGTTKTGADKIKSLGQKSKEIGNIVETIKTISEQTNLLALNAAIEAARAGEAGRGFAVVADEVRKLAEESKKASGQISEIISVIQEEINAAVTSMDINQEQVENGVNAVTEALASFEEIPLLVSQVDKAINEISAVSEENAAGSEEVNSIVGQVVTSTQSVTETAQELSKGAEELKQNVSKFKIK